MYTTPCNGKPKPRGSEAVRASLSKVEKPKEEILPEMIHSSAVNRLRPRPMASADVKVPCYKFTAKIMYIVPNPSRIHH